MKTFEIKVIERENHETKEKFLSYQALTKNGRWMDLKFTKEVDVKERPTHNCKISVENENISVERIRKYPVCWVSKISAVVEFDKVQDVSDYFE